MRRLKAMLDTNLYLNYLLSPDPEGTIVARLLQAAQNQSIDLLLPTDVIVEINTVVRDNPRLARRVTQQEIERLLRLISESARVLPLLEEDPPPVCRDPKDDFLIALAILHEAEYLVTRDDDLLALNRVLDLKIMTPGPFLAIVEREMMGDQVPFTNSSP